MRLNPKTILNFLSAKFDFVRLLFDLSKEDNTIRTEELKKICIENSVDIGRLIELKIIKELANGDYKLNKRYFDFLEFLFQEFSLSLPEALEARSNAIDDIFMKLQKETDKTKTATYISGLIDVIDDFLNDIDGYTTRLLNDTESIKSSADSAVNLTQRINKATYWIEEFIKPLNEILDKSHPKSIVNSISLMASYSNQRKFEDDDFNIRKQFDKLYFNALNANHELNVHINKLTRELLPLLDRIKTNSQILSGFYYFLEGYDRPESYIIPLPSLVSGSRHSTYSTIFDKEALLFIEHFRVSPRTYIEDEEPEIDNWLPDMGYYNEKLISELPIGNFYQWCFRTLSQENLIRDMMKFAAISNLIFSKEFDAEFDASERFELELTDVVLTLPKVKIYASISE